MAARASPPEGGTPVRLRTLLKRAEFQRTAGGVRVHRTLLTLQMRPRGDDQPEAGIGFTVTKREGHAVLRNRIKRRLREAARAILPAHAEPGADYVLIGRRAAAACPFQSLCADLKEALAAAARKAQRPAGSGARSKARP